MAPSSTRMRSAASRRSAFSALDMAEDMATEATHLHTFLLWQRLRATDAILIGPQAEQVADRVNEIGAVHGVEMKLVDAVVDEVEHLLGGNCRCDQFAR